MAKDTSGIISQVFLMWSMTIMGKCVKLFCYSYPNTMDGYLQNSECHKYTDDVVLCYAKDINHAIEIFSKLYNRELLNGNVREVIFNDFDIFIATDY